MSLKPTGRQNVSKIASGVKHCAQFAANSLKQQSFPAKAPK